MKGIDISICFIVASIYHKLSKTKDKVRRVATRFKWLFKFVTIYLYLFTAPGRISVVPELLNPVRSHCPPVHYAAKTFIIFHWFVIWRIC